MGGSKSWFFTAENVRKPLFKKNLITVLGVNHQKLSLKRGWVEWETIVFLCCLILCHTSPNGSHWGLSMLQEEAKCWQGSSEEAKVLGGWDVTFPNERAGRG